MPSNNAAYLPADKAPLEVKPAPFPTPSDNEFIVKSHAVAINPVDYGQQMFGPSFFPWMKFPCILGYDVAGEVFSIGSSITKFKPGDRVAGLSNTAFQQYTVVKEHLATSIPASISFEQAAVIPLCFSVAVKGLFHPEYLALDLPTLNTRPNSTDKTVLICGGSTSVGCNAVQLAKAAGYEVISTSSSSNFGYIKQLGASQVFDYSSPSLKADLLAALKDKDLIGAFANGAPRPDTFANIVDVCTTVMLSSTAARKFVALSMKPNFPIPDGIESKFIEPLEGDTELASKLFNGHLQEALEKGTFVPAPPPQVEGKGLEAIQGAMDVLKGGVSARKIVVVVE